jgi:hypothetical protein
MSSVISGVCGAGEGGVYALLACMCCSVAIRSSRGLWSRSGAIQDVRAVRDTIQLRMALGWGPFEVMLEPVVAGVWAAHRED